MNLSQMLTERDTRGTAYASAVDALKTAYVQLAGIDAALANKVVGNPAANLPVHTFGEFPDPIRLQHPVYKASIAGDWASLANAERDSLIAGLS
jgi:hypothetical protein